MTGSSTFTLVLSGDASVKAAGNVLDLLKGALAEHTSIAVDTTGIEQADVTTVQSILSARSKAAALGKTFALAGPPGEKLQSVLQSAGFLDPAQPAAPFWTQLH